MVRKRKVNIIRSTDFESVDEELGAAMVRLDEANVRVADLLGTEKLPQEGEKEAGNTAVPWDQEVTTGNRKEEQEKPSE